MAHGDLYVTEEGDLVWDTNESETGSALITDDETDVSKCCECDTDTDPPPDGSRCHECLYDGFLPHCCYESYCAEGDDGHYVGWPPLEVVLKIDFKSLTKKQYVALGGDGRVYKQCRCEGDQYNAHFHLTGICFDERGEKTLAPRCLWGNKRDFDLLFNDGVTNECDPPGKLSMTAGQAGTLEMGSNIGKPLWQYNGGPWGTAFKLQDFGDHPGKQRFTQGNCCGGSGPVVLTSECDPKASERVVGYVSFNVDVTGMNCCRGVDDNAGKEAGECVAGPEPGDCSTCCQDDNAGCENTQYKE